MKVHKAFVFIRNISFNTNNSSRMMYINKATTHK